MSGNLDLFSADEADLAPPQRRPLADALRPKLWDELQGFEQVDKNLFRQLREGRSRPPSMILWGPPGCGKTTIAKLIGSTFQCSFVELSAVLSGVKDVREVVEQAERRGGLTILFVDEIHRFNKAQQDAFLPHVERGSIVFIGATTENPSFYLTGALLSRVKVVTLKALDVSALSKIFTRACDELGFQFAEDARDFLLSFVGGDARRMLNALESFRETFPGSLEAPIQIEKLKEFLRDSHTTFYDRDGEEHYNVISAFIKSLRGSDPDAALFYGMWMLEAGEDPRFLCRRMMIFASEDVGNADPRALQLAVACADAFERLGLPEGRIPIGHCITYLASAPKSNRSYVAMNKAAAAAREHAKITVPLHLRNAPTGLMKKLGYGREYEYPHENAAGFVPGVQYLPEEVAGQRFYEPSDHGLEKAIKEKLQQIRSFKP